LTTAIVALALALCACAGPDEPPVSVDRASSTPGAATTRAAPGSATASAEDEAINPPEPIVIAAVGDLMFARDVATLMEQEGVAYPFARVLPLFEGADLLIGNLEGAFTDRGVAQEKTYTFRAPPALAPVLSEAGFDAVSLANNHSYDFGEVGLLDTLDALDGVGVASFGAGRDATEAYEARLLEVRGTRIALLGFNDRGGSQPAGPGVPGVATPSAEMVAAVEAAGAAADHVIVMFHWGSEYTQEVTARQRELAHAAIDAGAEVVLGSHPHVLQRVERYRGGVIAYSLGNFVFDLDAADYAELGSGPFETAVAVVTLGELDGPGIEFRPAFIDLEENRPRPATDLEAVAVDEAFRGD
jgi:poly-gamma-glutamate capsule biosynthesis protein CapA/YwtB (metallophosphatase superfamily)